MQTEHKFATSEYIFNAGIPRIVLALSGESLSLRQLITTTRVSQGTIEDGLNGLTAAGFIVVNRETCYPFRRAFTLTDKGIKLAQAFKQIFELVRPKPHAQSKAVA